MSKPIERFTLQSMNQRLGADEAKRYCLPLCFYMLLRAADKIDPNFSHIDFCADISREAFSTTNSDWSRPAMSKLVRKKYGVDVISWHLKGGGNIEPMVKSGYVDSTVEIEFFQRQILDKSVEQVVRSGMPVIVTMSGGFDHGGSNIHAIIIASWSDEEVVIVDPDERNPKNRYQPDYIQRFISTNGAGTIILP